MVSIKTKLRLYRKNVHPRLIIRQRIFSVIILILLVINIVNLVLGKLDILLALSGFFLAIMLGMLLSRIFKIGWHEEKEKVVGQLDAIGTLILILYIIAEVNRKWIFGHWLSGAQLNAFILIILTGIIIGRFLGTGFRIRTTLAEEEIIK